MSEKPKRRKMPNFDITDKKRENFTVVNAVNDALFKDPKLFKDIADIFDEVAKKKMGAKEKKEKLIESVSKLLSERVEGVDIESAKTMSPIWYNYFEPEKREFMMRFI